MSQVSNLSLESNLYSQMLVQRSDLSKVLEMGGGYNMMSTLIDVLSEGNSERVDVDKYETAYIGNGYIMNTIKGTPVIEDDKLVITLEDPKYAVFREDDVVMAGSLNIHGLVIHTEPGKIKIKPQIGFSMVDLQAAFSAGSIVKVFTFLSANRGSAGRTSLIEVPEVDFNYSSVLRESQSLARRDKLDSFIKYSGDFWYHAQQPRAMKRFARAREYATWYNQRGQFTNAKGELYDQFGGIDWAIKEADVARGVFEPLASLPSQKKFERFMADVLDRNYGAEKYKLMCMGRGMLNHIQSTFTRGFIENTGELNTFGGKSVKGLDVRMYQIAGLGVNFKILPHLSDREFFPEASNVPGAAFTQRQYDTYIMDLSPVDVRGGGSAPAIQQYHRGASRFYETFVAGIDSSPSGGVTDEFVKAQANKAIYMATDIDQSSYHVLSDMGIRFCARNSGKMELIS